MDKWQWKTYKPSPYITKDNWNRCFHVQ